MCRACEEIRAEIARLDRRRHNLALLAAQYEDSNHELTDAADELYDDLSDQLARLQHDLDELEETEAAQEAADDRAFGRWMASGL